jgi:hypothetical protein
MQTQSTAAAVPPTSLSAGAISRDAEIEQVLAVIKATHDGEQLSPRDLKLTEHVVNHGRAALTDAARARLDEVVAMVERGQYVQPWLHDIEHLTKDHQGYVKWRGHVVEHYSFRDADQEKAAAQMLGACCRFLEERGREVPGRGIFKAYDEARHGEGLGVRRWALHWATLPDRAEVAVSELEFESQDQAVVAMALSAADRQEDWRIGEGNVRSFKVVTQEDFDSAVEQLTQACGWAMHAVNWREYSNGRHASKFLDALHQAIPRQDLPKEADLMRRYFAGEGVEPAAHREAASAADARTAAPRERGAS